MTRDKALRHGIGISIVAVMWGVVTGGLSLVAGAQHGSVGLMGTGCDVLADVIGSVVLIWRFRAELHGSSDPVVVEKRAQLVTALGLVLVGVALAATASVRLVQGDRAEADAFTVSLAVVSLVGLPVLAIVKYRVAARLPSPALRTDAHTSMIGATTAAVTLLGLAATAALDWTSADAIAGLVIAATALLVGVVTLRAG